MKTILRLSFVLLFALSSNVYGQKEEKANLKNAPGMPKISGTWYMANETDVRLKTNKFFIKRGYITLKSKLNKQFSVRYTQDITLDKDGSGAGDVKVRLKYLYLKYKPFTKGAFNNSFLEIGLAHRPYVDFDQKIDDYRSQDKMFIEKVGIINSADFGVLFSGLFGGKLSQEQQKKYAKHNPGKWGSFAIGVFNGGGYHAFEANSNKTIEGRITFRPFSGALTGLQLTYAGAFGQGNRKEYNPFRMHLFALSLEDESYSFMAQYYLGKGDYRGKYMLQPGKVSHNKGYAVYAEYKIFHSNWALFGRYDTFSSDYPAFNYLSEGYFGGIAYRFLKNKIYVSYGKDTTYTGIYKEKLNVILEVKF